MAHITSNYIEEYKKYNVKHRYKRVRMSPKKIFAIFVDLNRAGHDNLLKK